MINILTHAFYAAQTFGIKFAFNFILATMNINKANMVRLLCRMQYTLQELGDIPYLKHELTTLIHDLYVIVIR